MRLPLWVNAADDLYLNVQALQNCENLRSYTKVLRNIKKVISTWSKKKG